ncbi:MAG: hypothetical protein MdMp014T_1873 [Treponematales bacterium]
MRLDDFSLAGMCDAIAARESELNGYIRKVHAENFIKIGVVGENEPEYMPGILDSIEVSDALLVDDVQTQNKGGSIKIISGWADCDLSITLLLIDLPNHTADTVTPAVTRFDCLQQIAKIFKQMANNKPRVYTIQHPHIAAWGTREFVFHSLKSNEARGKRVINCTLEFDEFDSVSGKSQDRQLGMSSAQAAQPKSVTPPVSNKDRAGLGAMEAKFAKS